MSADEFIGALDQARFEDIFDNEEKSRNFHDFLIREAIPAKGFAVSFPMENGLAWMFYRIAAYVIRRGRVDLELEERMAFVPTKPNDRSVPDELTKYPIYSLEELFSDD